jgi:SIR2-like domain
MSDISSQKLAVILGAGASRGCLGNGIAAHANNQWLPPLAKELFDRRFDPLLSRFIRLAAHLDDVRTVLSSEGSNFEKCLRDFYRSAERSGDRWPLDIPLYLRELLWTVSDEYLQGSSKYDTLVQRVLGSSFEKIMFLNLNYDLFVENALRNCNRHLFDSVRSYIPRNKKWLLIKPHGSVNWARILENWPKYASGDLMPFPSDMEEPPRFGSAIEVVLRTMQTPRGYYIAGVAERRLYPQLVVPVEDPSVKKFVCPKEHEEEAKAFIGSCQTFVAIGFSGRDDDVLDLLQGMPRSSRLIVVGNGDAANIAERICGANAPIRAKCIVPELHDGGFAPFVESSSFRNLVAPNPATV